jgi:hypothetical protein
VTPKRVQRISVHARLEQCDAKFDALRDIPASPAVTYSYGRLMGQLFALRALRGDLDEIVAAAQGVTERFNGDPHPRPTSGRRCRRHCRASTHRRRRHDARLINRPAHPLSGLTGTIMWAYSAGSFNVRWGSSVT